MEIKGLILAGGQNSRMGRTKALLEYGGVPQYQRVARLLGNFTSQIIISAGEAEQHRYSGFKTISDLPEWSGKGPASGLISAMTIFPRTAWLVVGCDYPLLVQDDLQFLLEHRQQNSAGTFYQNSEGFTEPLVGIYENGVEELLLKWLNAGNTSLRHFLELQGALVIPAPFPERLVSADTPEKYDVMNRMISGLKP